MASGPQGYAVGLIPHLFDLSKIVRVKAQFTLAWFLLCFKREEGQAHFASNPLLFI